MTNKWFILKKGILKMAVDIHVDLNYGIIPADKKDSLFAMEVLLKGITKQMDVLEQQELEESWKEAG